MGRIIEYIKMAFKSIGANKGRSILTMLGIIIGIGSVIMILAVGAGGKKMMNEQFEKMGANGLYIMINWENAGESDYISMEDIQQIKERVPGVVAASPSQTMSGEVRTDKKFHQAYISYYMPDAFLMADMDLKWGRLWNQSDYDNARNVCIIDQTGAKALFGTDDVVGMKVDLQLEGRSGQFTIVGVQKREGILYSYAQESPAYFYLPLTSVLKLTGSSTTSFYQLQVKLAEDADPSLTSDRIVRLLEARHGSRGRDAYYVEDMSQSLAQITQIQDMFVNIIAAIAAISLLVGGIGVMNIMLVSVTERTREIGIRKALGAKTGSILFQFLVEAAFITMIGGIIGIVLGLAGANALGGLVGLEPYMDPIMMLGVVLFSSGVGLFFGIYPARKAAKLHPIEALRAD